MKNPSLKSATRPAKVAFLFLLILLGALALPVHAAPRGIVTVTNTNDIGFGSLRDATITANPGDTIAFSLTLPATITVAGPLVITQSLTIAGPGDQLLSISGDWMTRVMTTSSETSLNLSGITIRSGQISWEGSAIYNAGRLNLTSSSIVDNSGAPIVNTGTMNIANTFIRDNHSVLSSSAIENFGIMSLTNSTVSGNGAYGGAVSNYGTLTIANSRVSGNAGRGGAIGNGGTLLIVDTTIAENFAWGGAGLSNSGTATVVNSTFSGNITSSIVGVGGGIYNSGVATILNSTLFSNTASLQGISHGGGIYDSGTMSIVNSTVASNGASTGGGIYLDPCCRGAVTLKNTIVIKSSPGENCSGSITEGGNNIEDGMTCGWGLPGSSNGSLRMLDPHLGLLANNGGPTLTMALLPSSPAIDGVTYNAPNGCPSADQRGVSRPQGVRCDTGAFEVMNNFLFLPLILK